MSIRVLSFAATLPPKDRAGANHKLRTLELFVRGVMAQGDWGMITHDQQYQRCDVAVMLGWVHENGKRNRPHLQFRQTLIDQQRRNNARTLVADSNLFLYADPANPHCYQRYSFDGVFPNTGEYCDARPDPQRWQILQQHMNIQVKPWRTTGDHILLCCQRQGGWSMGAQSVVDWVSATVRTLRAHTNRPIRVRGHPGDRTFAQYQHQLTPLGVHISDAAHSLVQDLQGCWAAVNHNSSPVIAAALEGVPIFVTDPERSQARDVANLDLAQIENPQRPDRQAWLERLAQSHWSLEDLASGLCWRHMREWVRNRA